MNTKKTRSSGQTSKGSQAISRKTKRASGMRCKCGNAKCRADKLPPDPEGDNDLRASLAAVAINVFRRAAEVDKEDAVGDLLTNLMHLCDRDHAIGTFDDGLIRAFRHYKQETATDAEYARIYETP